MAVTESWVSISANQFSFPNSAGGYKEPAVTCVSLKLLSDCGPPTVSCSYSLLLFRGRHRRLNGKGLQAQFAAQFDFQLGRNILIFFQELLRILASLANPLTFIAEPGSGFLHHTLVHSQVQQVSFAGDAFSVHDVKFGLSEGRSRFVLYNLDFSPRAYHQIGVFDGGNAADIHADGRIKLERPATSGGFRVAEHDPDLFPDLIDKDQAGARLGDNARKFAQSLGHKAGLQAHVAVSHFTFQFSF